MDDSDQTNNVGPQNLADIQRYKDLCQAVGKCVEPCTMCADSPGDISIVITGIKSIAHCTLESLTEIKRSKYVFFLVDDTVTELFLKDLRPDGIDLNVMMHDCSNDTIGICVKIVEICLHHSRKGFNVCLVLHGDSSIAVMISQRLLKIAKREGIDVKTISSPILKDGLAASMEIDINISSVVMNAVEFLLSYTELDMCSNVILRHIGDVKNTCYNGSRSGLQSFQLLIAKLMKTYLDSQEVVLYQGTQYSVVHSPYEHVTLAFLSNISDEQFEKIPNDSSLFIPVTVEPPVDISMGMALGCLHDGTPAHTTVKRELGLRHDYGTEEKGALQSLQKWVLPDCYISPKDNDLSDLICEMSLNSNLLHHWETTGQPVLKDDLQNDALQSRNETVIEEVLRCHEQHSTDKNQSSGHVQWTKLKGLGQRPTTPRQMIVLYENDIEYTCDDSSVSSDDSEIIREAYTVAPREEPTSPSEAKE